MGVRQAGIEGAERPGISTLDKSRIREFERENAQLRRANEILKSAMAFLGAELDR
jgi:transposase